MTANTDLLTKPAVKQVPVTKSNSAFGNSSEKSIIKDRFNESANGPSLPAQPAPVLNASWEGTRSIPNLTPQLHGNSCRTLRAKQERQNRTILFAQVTLLRATATFHRQASALSKKELTARLDDLVRRAFFSSERQAGQVTPTSLSGANPQKAMLSSPLSYTQSRKREHQHLLFQTTAEKAHAETQYGSKAQARAAYR